MIFKMRNKIFLYHKVKILTVADTKYKVCQNTQCSIIKLVNDGEVY